MPWASCAPATGARSRRLPPFTPHLLSVPLDSSSRYHDVRRMSRWLFGATYVEPTKRHSSHLLSVFPVAFVKNFRIASALAKEVVSRFGTKRLGRGLFLICCLTSSLFSTVSGSGTWSGGKEDFRERIDCFRRGRFVFPPLQSTLLAANLLMRFRREEVPCGREAEFRNKNGYLEGGYLEGGQCLKRGGS
ncbi:hypothetical protein VUR80DRAFT_8353 [Thermomyces stellatus]